MIWDRWFELVSAALRCILRQLKKVYAAFSALSTQGPVSWKARNIFEPKKPFLKVWTTHFHDVFKIRNVKRVASKVSWLETSLFSRYIHTELYRVRNRPEKFRAFRETHASSVQGCWRIVEIRHYLLAIDTRNLCSFLPTTQTQSGSVYYSLATLIPTLQCGRA